jgi:membrane fusion protein, multidrug efflux system
MNKKTVWIAVVFVIIAGLLIMIAYSKPSEKEQGKEKGKKERPQKKVSGFVVNPTTLIDEISVSGSLQAFESVDLKNEVAGRVVSINLPEGKFVKTGTLLVKLFDEDLQATLKKIQAQLAVQQEIFKRQSELLKVNGVSQNDYELTGLQINSLKADIEIEKALIRKTEVRAPFDGIIGLRSISVGAIVTPSTQLATIRTENKIKLDFYVPEKYGSEIKPGMKVKFSLSNSKKQYDATVFATERGIDNSTRNLKVRAQVNTLSKELLSGGFSSVNLRMSERKDALMVPSQALIPQDDKMLLVVARQGKAKFINVQTGLRKATFVEIKNVLQPGDTVVTSGILFVKDGAKLSFSNVQNKL